MKVGNGDVCQVPSHVFPVLRPQLCQQGQLCDTCRGVFLDKLRGQLFHNADIVISLALADMDGLFRIGPEGLKAQGLITAAVAHTL